MSRPSLSRQLRILIALGAVIGAGTLAAAEDGNFRAPNCAAHNAPSKLDYVVLASFVDSPHLLSMAGYRATGPHAAWVSEETALSDGADNKSDDANNK